MYKVVFYRDKNGREPVIEMMRELRRRNDKDSRINLAKINDYLETLRIHGTTAGEPYMKYLEDKIWELRPLRNRILFFCFDGEKFIMLSHFIKKTQKTPKREIEKAKRLMTDFLERSKDNDQE